jgi:hypothetical protein
LSTPADPFAYIGELSQTISLQLGKYYTNGSIPPPSQRGNIRYLQLRH